MNRLRLLISLTVVVVLAVLALLLHAKRQTVFASNQTRHASVVNRITETIPGDTDTLPDESTENKNDFGPGWHGENLHAGFKLLKGIRTNLYDYDRGLAKRPRPYPLNEVIAKAETRGADFKLSFLVKDQYDNPIEGVDVVIGAFQRGPGSVFSGKTDGNGIATITGFGTGELLVSFTSGLHYHTSFRYEFFDPYFECARDGRWLPWNPLLPVTMIRKGEGEVDSAYDATFTVPKGECDIGVDLIRGEVATLANFNGTPNCILRFLHIDSDNGEEKPMSLCIDFIDEGCGGQMVKSDRFSDLPWPVAAPEEGYERQLRFAWCRENIPCALPRIKEDDMILFRVKAEDGLFRYGVIKYPLSTNSQGRFLRLMVSVNAEHPDSRNLEPVSEIKVQYKYFKIGGKNAASQFGDARANECELE